MDRGSGQPQLDVETKGYEYRYRYNLPADFRERVCTCEQHKIVIYHWACGSCGKPPVHTLHVCVDCGTMFIRDFFFPWFCTVDPTCYECSKNIAAPCLRHGIIPWLRERYTTTSGAPLGKPLGLNPRELTDDERNALEDEFTLRE